MEDKFVQLVYCFEQSFGPCVLGLTESGKVYTRGMPFDDSDPWRLVPNVFKGVAHELRQALAQDGP